MKTLKGKLELSGHKLECCKQNLVDLVWSEKPPLPLDPIKILDVKYAGKSFETKVAEIRKELESKNMWGMVVSSLDEVAWLFNLRGSDVCFNPVFLSYAIVTKDEATLYTRLSKITQEVRDHFKGQVVFKEYEKIFDDLAEYGLVRGLSAKSPEVIIS